MPRSLIWMDGHAGWSCSHCRWMFQLPTPSHNDEDAVRAHAEVAATKFREHKCQGPSPASLTNPQPKPNVPTFVDRARLLIMRGYPPNDAVQQVVREIAFESGNDPNIVAKARMDADTFLLRLRRGMI